MGKLNVPAGEYAISPKRKFRDLSEEFIEENKDFSTIETMRNITVR